MATTSVFAPLFDDGLTSINFFNGRLLSAEDLTTERKANRERHRRLAQAIGDGVVSGLEVTESSTSTAANPAVVVTAGMGINRTGDSIRLEHDTEVSLRVAQPANGDSTSTVTLFQDCDPRREGTYVPSAGAYLLTIRPVRGGTGLAPVSGLGNQTAQCSTKYVVDGVEFELLEMSLGAEASDTAHLRNRLAYACFGAADLTDAASAPFGSGVGDYGRIGALRDSGALSPCALPLAVIHWTGGGVQFIDQWAARRRPTPTASADVEWQMPLARRRASETEAMLYQFQDHLDALRQDLADPRSARASSYFRYLPPAGLVPITSASYPSAFDYPAFFTDCYRREPVFIDAARVEPLLRTSWQYPPIDLNDGHMMWLYWVRQNAQAIEKSASSPPERCLLFASGDMPFVGQARFDVSRWDYSNYSLVEGALD